MESFNRWFAEKLQFLRKREGMTQKEFAEECGIGVATYERLERGQFCPRRSTCLLIAQTLNIRLSVLFEGFEQAIISKEVKSDSINEQS